MSSNYCVCCGDEIPEGRQVCPNCENIKFQMKKLDKVTEPSPDLLPRVVKIRGTSRYAVYAGGRGKSIVLQVCKTKKQAVTLAASRSGMNTKEYLKFMKGEQDNAET